MLTRHYYESYLVKLFTIKERITSPIVNLKGRQLLLHFWTLRTIHLHLHFPFQLWHRQKHVIVTSHWQDHCRRLSFVIHYSHHRRSHRRAPNLQPSVVIEVVRCHTGCRCRNTTRKVNPLLPKITKAHGTTDNAIVAVKSMYRRVDLKFGSWGARWKTKQKSGRTFERCRISGYQRWNQLVEPS